MGLRPAISLILLAIVDSLFAEKCVLPRMEENLNWDKMSGNWYQLLNTDLDLDRATPCVGIQNMTATDHGVKLTYVDYHQKSHNYGTVTVEEHFHDGFYRRIESADHHRKEEMEWKKEFEKDADDSVDGAVIRDLDQTYTEKIAYFSDYEHYFIGMVCGEEGARMLWVHDRSPRATAEDILRIRNALIRIGEGWDSVLLDFSGCPYSDNLDDYVRE